MDAALLLLATLVALNLWATWRVLKAEEPFHRKLLLGLGTWLIPFMGAFLAHLHARPPESALSPHDEGPAARPGAGESARREPAPWQIGVLGGVTFSLQQHMQWADGVPVLDWAALNAWAAGQGEGAVASRALDQGRRAWLLHLRDWLGDPMVLHETAEAYILSTLAPRPRKSMADYVARTRVRVGRLLQGLARLAPEEKNIVLVLDNEEDYYRYVATYYPSEGEFAFSGGMFINAGCPHFVVVQADLATIEPVIAHEMTHSALSHLRLPVWLDEGIAVNTEHKLAGATRLIYTPHEIHAMHRRFWNEATIQEFWSGASFHRSDEGQLLSYQLARTMVEQLASEWEAFRAFVSQARREDAGAAAARSALSVDLGACVAALVEANDPQGWHPRPMGLELGP